MVSDYIAYGLGQSSEVRGWQEEGGTTENVERMHRWQKGHGWSPRDNGEGGAQFPQDGCAWLAGQEVLSSSLYPGK